VFRFKRNKSKRGPGVGTPRSPLEKKVQAQLDAAKVVAQFETLNIPYVPLRARFYKPDFILPNGIIVETKGWFISSDRAKHLAVKAQHPDLDIRFVFPSANKKISKQSETTYAVWCESKGFLYSEGSVIPPAWLVEPPNVRSLAAIAALMKEKKT
jgi:hypothetical protein